ncbi:hypothetical protein QUB10_01085 [Microcoleus sp. B5-D4]|uniref:hypothetical protein n=1 Tax=unclassified Microcoleus TaxID=2642155 RepID=UPI002FCFA761
MPVPQRVKFLVEQASCLLLTMVQDVSINDIAELGYLKTQQCQAASATHCQADRPNKPHN